jgi:hypothetical protein
MQSFFLIWASAIFILFVKEIKTTWAEDEAGGHAESPRFVIYPILGVVFQPK